MTKKLRKVDQFAWMVDFKIQKYQSLLKATLTTRLKKKKKNWKIVANVDL